MQRLLSYLLLAILLPVLIAGCSSSNSPPPVLTDGIWIGFQDGDGQWVTLTESSNPGIPFQDFPALPGVTDGEGRYGVAVAVADASEKSVSIFSLQATTAEIHPEDLLNLINLLDLDRESAVLSVARPDVAADAAKATFSVPGYSIQTYNEIATLYTDGRENTTDLVVTTYETFESPYPNKILVARDIPIEAGETVSIGSDYAYDLFDLDATYTVNGMAGMTSGNVYARTPGGTIAKLGEAVNDADAFIYAAIEGAWSGGYSYFAALYGQPSQHQRVIHYEWFDIPDNFDFNEVQASFSGACITVNDTGGTIRPALDGSIHDDALGFAVQFQGISASHINYNVMALATQGWLGPQRTSFGMPEGLRHNRDWDGLWSIPADTNETFSAAMVLAGNAGFEFLGALSSIDLELAPYFEDGTWLTVVTNSASDMSGAY